MDGVQKAAIFLMSLGEDVASEVMKHLSPKEVQNVGSAMSKVENVHKDEAEGVLLDFNKALNDQTALGVGSPEYVRKVLVKALGEDKAKSILDRISLGGGNNGLEQLKWLDGKTVAEMIRLEHPQIIALVLGFLEPDHAATVLSEMPDRVRHDIIMRIATLDGIQPTALEELDKIMEKHFEGKDQYKSSSVGGTQAAADILNFIDSSMESNIMDSIAEVDSELSEDISDLMFLFDDLMDVDDRGVQALLREISTDVLVLALKGADEGLKEKFLRNLSKRAAEMLQDDLETSGPVRVSEVETAQKDILAVAKRLADDGTIMLGGSGEEFI
ncbi:MAG: flagellar motor switch protein FliG [Gammaproteobacteria bacterium]|nr:MAG: flagellar motor switch protein FliG [Gammaproteobacteria bacterium]